MYPPQHCFALRVVTLPILQRGKLRDAGCLDNLLSIRWLFVAWLLFVVLTQALPADRLGLFLLFNLVLPFCLFCPCDLTLDPWVSLKNSSFCVQQWSPQPPWAASAVYQSGESSLWRLSSDPCKGSLFSRSKEGSCPFCFYVRTSVLAKLSSPVGQVPNHWWLPKHYFQG